MTDTAPETRPITGTWLNLFHQDRRNDYTNPTGDGPFDPEYWRTKVADYASLGVEILVILAVVNDGRSAYASPTRPPAYGPGPESPLDAILGAADELGLRVFLSCGFVNDQFDQQATQTVREGQQEIMSELAALYGKRPSFFGWYLPCEDSFAPRPPAAAIAAVNDMCRHARTVTPEAVLLISPYFMHAAVIDDAYVEALDSLDVDVIAYQDGVGCVFAHDVTDAWRKLREAHDRVPRIALWANVETFTWEHGVANVQTDALVPAAFPRILRQLVSASAYVERTISFIVQGMFDVAGTDRPCGQAGLSEELATDYRQWRDGATRWRLLESTLSGRVDNLALGCAVSLVEQPTPHRWSARRLTDGETGGLDLLSDRWLGFCGVDLDATVDLGRLQTIRSVALRYLHFAPLEIRSPTRVEFLTSTDGVRFTPLATVAPGHWPNDRLDAWADLAVVEVPSVQATHVRVRARNAGRWLYVDELIVG